MVRRRGEARENSANTSTTPFISFILLMLLGDKYVESYAPIPIRKALGREDKSTLK